jgi:hypothetical protein
MFHTVSMMFHTVSIISTMVPCTFYPYVHVPAATCRAPGRAVLRRPGRRTCAHVQYSSMPYSQNAHTWWFSVHMSCMCARFQHSSAYHGRTIMLRLSLSTCVRCTYIRAYVAPTYVCISLTPDGCGRIPIEHRRRQVVSRTSKGRHRAPSSSATPSPLLDRPICLLLDWSLLHVDVHVSARTRWLASVLPIDGSSSNREAGTSVCRARLPQ